MVIVSVHPIYPLLKITNYDNILTNVARTTKVPIIRLTPLKERLMRHFLFQ